jgi:hypothetical protein
MHASGLLLSDALYRTGEERAKLHLLRRGGVALMKQIELANATLPGRGAGQLKRDSFLFHLHGESAALQGLADAVAELDESTK